MLADTYFSLQAVRGQEWTGLSLTALLQVSLSLPGSVGWKSTSLPANQEFSPVTRQALLSWERRDVVFSRDGGGIMILLGPFLAAESGCYYLEPSKFY